MNDRIVAVVTRKRKVAEQVFAFTLSVEPESFVQARAGAHVDVFLPDGLIRQYSLTKPAMSGDLAYEIAVLREEEGRGGSLALCDNIETGSRIEVSAPRNHFAIETGQAHYVLVGAGIGITPLLAIARQLHEDRASFELHACAGVRELLPFADELETAPWSDRVIFHFSRADPSSRIDLAALVSSMRAEAQLYACGPARFLDELASLTRAWPTGRLRTERFTADAARLSGNNTGSFEIELKTTGKSFTVNEDESILDVLARNGIPVETSCTEGVCGTCITGVVSGTPVHRDSCLYEEEQAEGNLIAVCVSRAAPGTRLVLDL